MNESNDVLTHDRIQAEIAKLLAETAKLNDERDKMRAEASKLSAEADKYRNDLKWHPVALTLGVATAAATIALALSKFFGA